MASGNTLVALFPTDVEGPASNFATLAVRNNHPVLQFDDTTQEAALFTVVMPAHYAGGGITVSTHSTMKTATSGTLGYDVSIERVSDATTDIDADSFATAQTITAATVPGTSGVVLVQSVNISNGANMDSVAVGEAFRLRLRRDVANDSATGDAELIAIEIKET